MCAAQKIEFEAIDIVTGNHIMSESEMEILPGIGSDNGVNYARLLLTKSRKKALCTIIKYIRVPFICLLSIGIFAASISSMYRVISDKYCNYKSEFETNACHGVSIVASFFIYVSVLVTMITTLLFFIACRLQTRDAPRYNL
jgi:hypothetical protein